MTQYSIRYAIYIDLLQDINSNTDGWSQNTKPLSDINQKKFIQPTTYFVVCRKKCFHLKVNFGNYVLQKHFYGIAVYASFDFWYLF